MSLNAVEGAFEEGNAVALFHLARHIDHRFRAHHHRGARAMGISHFPIFAVTRNAGEDANAQFVEQRLHLPQLAGEIIFSNDIDVVGRRVVGLFGADHMLAAALRRRACSRGFSDRRSLAN